MYGAHLTFLDMLYMREYCDAEKIDMQDFGAFTPYQHP
jgi:hypothetical protein